MDEEDLKKLENEIGEDNLMNFVDIMTKILAKQGDKRALIAIQIEKIMNNMHNIYKNVLKISKEKNEEKLEETENFCIQINKIIEDYMKEN